MIQIENLDTHLNGFNLHGINLTIEEGEFFILMGPTGAGKTVLLEVLAGLVPIKNGRILVSGQDVTGLPPEKRGIGIVYQDYVLFPHMTVLENIKYGLHFHKICKETAEKRLEKIIAELDLTNLKNRFPVNLSGGEQQRVALARALMVNPSVLLLDEPLSALDPNFREEIRHDLKKLHRSSNTTLLMVTHDFAEALSLADRGAVINHGRIEQIGNMEDIFQRPGTRFIADFVGMKNIFEARFKGSKAVIGKDLEVDLGQRPSWDQGHIAIRPDDIAITREKVAANNRNSFGGVVTSMIDQGFYYEAHIQVGELTFKSLIPKKSLVQLSILRGTKVFLSFETIAVHTIS